MKNQSVILYIFPHIYPFAQPKRKRPVLATGFLFLHCAADLNLRKVGSLPGAGGRKHAGEALAEAPQRQLSIAQVNPAPAKNTHKPHSKKRSYPFITYNSKRFYFFIIVYWTYFKL